MIDYHIHIERGNYTREWINQFVDYAQKRNIKEIYLLEHSHRFIDFYKIYDNVIGYNDYQGEWLKSRNCIELEEYVNFISSMKKLKFPIKINWGLEICYIPEHESTIREIVNKYNFDFLTGSIHWIDGWGFDHPKNICEWKTKDVNLIYNEYYQMMMKLVDSNLFDVVAHPDSIKCFYYVPSDNMKETYDLLASKLKKYNMKAEYSCGLFMNYKHSEIGPNIELFKSLISYNVDIVTGSDAHRPEDVGRYILEANERIDKML